MSATAKGTLEGEAVDFEGGLTLLSDRAFVNYKGTEYEVDPTTFGFVKSSFEQAAAAGRRKAGSDEATACQERPNGSKSATSSTISATKAAPTSTAPTTTKISGDLDVGSAIDAIIKLTENPACSAQLEAAGPLPLDELEAAKGELDPGDQESPCRRLRRRRRHHPQACRRTDHRPKDRSNEKVEVEFELSLGDVNEEQDI